MVMLVTNTNYAIPRTYPVGGGTFTPGIIGGMDRLGEVSVYDFIQYNAIVGIIDDFRDGTTDTTQNSGLITVWTGTLDFETDQVDYASPFCVLGQFATWSRIDRKWGAMTANSLPMAIITKLPTSIATTLGLHYDPSIYANASGLKNVSGVPVPGGVSMSCATPSQPKIETPDKYGCHCTKCNEYYEYAVFREGFICKSCNSYREMFS